MGWKSSAERLVSTYFGGPSALIPFINGLVQMGPMGFSLFGPAKDPIRAH